MRITESRLRSIIRSVIRESNDIDEYKMSAEGYREEYSDAIDIACAESRKKLLNIYEESNGDKDYASEVVKKIVDKESVIACEGEGIYDNDDIKRVASIVYTFMWSEVYEIFMEKDEEIMNKIHTMGNKLNIQYIMSKLDELDKDDLNKVLAILKK